MYVNFRRLHMAFRPGLGPIQSGNLEDHGDRAVDFGFRNDDAEVSRASDGSSILGLR